MTKFTMIATKKSLELQVINKNVFHILAFQETDVPLTKFSLNIKTVKKMSFPLK